MTTKQERINAIREELNHIEKALDDVENGVSVVRAGEENGLAGVTFAAIIKRGTWIASTNSKAYQRLAETQVKDLKDFGYDWDVAFLKTLGYYQDFKTSKELPFLPPADLYSTVKYIIFNEIKTFRNKEQVFEIFKQRFIEQKTFEDTGNYVGVTLERVRQIESYLLWQLRNPVYKDLLLFGMAKKPELDDLKHQGEAIQNRLFKRVLEEKKKEIENKADVDNEITPPLINTIYVGLSTRAVNCLRRGDVHTAEELIEKYPSPQCLFRIRNLGLVTCAELIDKMHELGAWKQWDSDSESIQYYQKAYQSMRKNRS